MPTNFPTSLDAYTIPTTPATTPLGTAGGASDKHSGLHKDEIDAIQALETKVGINGSADVTSVDSKLNLWQANVNANNFNLSNTRALSLSPNGTTVPISYNNFTGPAEGYSFLAANPTVTLNASNTNLTGLNFAPTLAMAGFNLTNLTAVMAETLTSGVGTITEARGVRALIGGSNITTGVCFDALSGGDFLGNPGTAIAFRVGSGALNSATNWCFQVDNFNSFHIGGMVFGSGVAPSNTSCAVEINSTTKTLRVANMTTTQRNALTALNGMIIYNTTNLAMEGFVNGAWITL